MQPRGELCRDYGAMDALEMKLLDVKDLEFLGLLWRFFPFIYRLPDRSASLLLQVCKERKWKSLSDSAGGDQCYQSWNLWWRTSMVKSSRLMPQLHTWQTVNYIPNAATYCKKDVLVRYNRRMLASFGSLYDFCPISFNLPTEYSQLVSEHRRRRGIWEEFMNMEETKVVWIAKPVGKSQGKGIFVFERCSDLRYDDQYVVQEYIHRPLLINGYKWDLRLYVCITCNNPLTIYAYEEGIARFATRKYDLSDLEDTFSHLTNTSLNKQSPTYYKHKDIVGLGSKWSLAQLRTYFKKHGIQDYVMWQKIWSVLVLTIIGEGKQIGQQTWKDTGFQFLGFDVLVDDRMKPHLLEVNVHPGLGSDKCPVDLEVKIPLLHDMFDLLNLPDGRNFPDSAVPSILESTNQLCAKIMDALKDPEHNIQPSTSAKPTQEEKIFNKIISAYKLTKPLSSTSSCSSFTTTRKLDRVKQKLKQKPKGSKSSNSKIRSVVIVDANNNENLVKNNSLPSVAEQNPGTSSLVQLTSHCITTTTQSNAASAATCSRIVHLPVLKKSSARLHLPTNGPGVSYLPRDWKDNAPTVCGKWVRIFPFDKTSSNCSSFSRPNDCRDSINRVGAHLQAVRELITGDANTKNRGRDDSLYDDKLEQHLNTKVWHPR